MNAAMNIALAEGLPEWIEKPLYSGWFYAIIGGFFFIVFIWGIVRLFWKNSTPPQAEPAGADIERPFDYSPLLTLIGKLNGSTNTILLAAGSWNDLPVTVPVHVAVQLAASCKCLLIDLDTKRNALACVFDIRPDKQPALSAPVATPIKNLHIWPAHYFTRIRHRDIKAAIAGSEKKYDIILLNAPYLATHPNRKQIIRCADSAVIFVQNKLTAVSLLKLFENSPCRVIQMLNLNGRPFI